MAQKKSPPRSSAAKYKVSGQVFNPKKEPIAGQTVLAADVDLLGAAIYRSARTLKELRANKGFEFLGTTRTNADGYYEVAFTTKQYKNREIGLADVVVFAVDDDVITGRSDLAAERDYTGNTITHWDVRLTGLQKRGSTEFALLMRVIDPFVRQSKLALYQLAPSADQISFLAAETKQELTHTSLAVQADQLKVDCSQGNNSTKRPVKAGDNLPFNELFYGIGRQNILLTWPSLLMKSDDDLRRAIGTSADQNIISAYDEKEIVTFLAVMRYTSLKEAPHAPETADFFKVIGFTLKEESQQHAFAQAFVQSGDQPEVFWTSLAEQHNFSKQTIQALQLSNQLSILTGQHTQLMEELQVVQGIKDPSDLLRLPLSAWQKLIQKAGVPDSVTGDTPEVKAGNYINGMQNRLNASYPTQRIALMIESDLLPPGDTTVRGNIVAFFSAATDFDISTSRITDPAFDAVLKKISGNHYDQTQKQIQLLQRIYRVSPTTDAMTVLVRKGYQSAHHISSFSQSAFVRLEADDLGGVAIALDVYNRARHQVMQVRHTALRFFETQDRATPSKIITPAQRQAVADTLNTLTPPKP